MKYTIIGEKDLPGADARITVEFKPRQRRTVLSSSLKAEKKVYPAGIEVYTNPNHNKKRTFLDDFTRKAKDNYKREERPDSDAVVEINKNTLAEKKGVEIRGDSRF